MVGTLSPQASFDVVSKNKFCMALQAPKSQSFLLVIFCVVQYFKSQCLTFHIALISRQRVSYSSVLVSIWHYDVSRVLFQYLPFHIYGSNTSSACLILDCLPVYMALEHL